MSAALAPTNQACALFATAARCERTLRMFLTALRWRCAFLRTIASLASLQLHSRPGLASCSALIACPSLPFSAPRFIVLHCPCSLSFIVHAVQPPNARSSRFQVEELSPTLETMTPEQAAAGARATATVADVSPVTALPLCCAKLLRPSPHFPLMPTT